MIDGAEFSHIRYAIEGDIAWVTVDRPDRRNALNEAARAELIEAVDRASASVDARVIVITGAGEEAFVAGADLAEGAAGTVTEQRALLEGRRIYDAVAESPKPVIAMINGHCLGSGCELALAADIRIAGERARIGLPEINLAMIPGGGGTQRLPRLIGPGQAMRMILTGVPLDAQEALGLGLVDLVVPDGVLRARTIELGKRIARHSPLALALAKQAVRAAQELPLQDGLARERELFLRAFDSEDRREGVQAFLEKRKPVFVGR